MGDAAEENNTNVEVAENNQINLKTVSDSSALTKREA
jgi:hypothetical protein